MAPLPENNTARVFFDYITGNAATSLEHTASIRVNQTFPSPADLDPQEKFLAFLTAIGTARFRLGWRVIRVRVQNAGADFSVPQDVIPSLAAFQGSTSGGTYNSINECQEYSFQGRSFTTGRRVSLSLYGLAIAVPENFRLTPTTAPFITDAVGELNDGTPLQVVTIDGTPAIWNRYINVQYNSYWERRSRVG